MVSLSNRRCKEREVHPQQLIATFATAVFLSQREISLLRVLEKEIGVQFCTGGNGVFFEVTDALVSENLFVDEEIAGAVFAVASENGVGRVGYDFWRAAAGYNFVAAE